MMAVSLSTLRPLFKKTLGSFGGSSKNIRKSRVAWDPKNGTINVEKTIDVEFAEEWGLGRHSDSDGTPTVQEKKASITRIDLAEV